MRIGIIGAGNMGAALAVQLTRLGHQVAIANSCGPRTLADVAAQTGAAPVPISEVTSNANFVVIAAIPEKSIPALPAGLLAAPPEDTVVIDTGNYVLQLSWDGHIFAIDVGLPESQWVQSQLRHPVVKAFNTIRPTSLATLGKPAGAAGGTVIPVAGNDPAAKAVVLELADQMGFDGVDAGSLAESWRQQPGTPIYTTDLPLHAARQALAAAAPEQTASWRSRHPQRTKPNTAMHPGSRTGVRIVPGQPRPTPAAWTTSTTGTTPTPQQSPSRATSPTTPASRTPGASGENSSPRYATIYDIVAPDPATAWPDTEHSPAYPTRLFSDPRATLVSPALRASYALVGSQLQPSPQRPAHRHPRHLVQRRRRHRTPAPGGAADPADRPVLLRRPIPAHRSDPPAPPDGSGDIRDRSPRTPSTPTPERPAATPAPQIHPGAKPVIPPDRHPRNQSRVSRIHQRRSTRYIPADPAQRARPASAQPRMVLAVPSSKSAPK